METKQCNVCGKQVEGFSTKDVEYKMIMHMIKHRNDKIKEVEKEVN